MHVLVAGCGWLGTALARALVAGGHRVTGIRREPARARDLAPLGVEPLALDLASAGAASRIPRVDAIVACQAARGESPDAYRRAYLDASRALLEAAARGGVRALVYTGSTGVFGQADGGDVDEDSPVAPASPGARLLVEAEALLRDAAARGVPARILRLSGLYGPGRTGVVERVRAGAMALGPGDDAWTNWCHLDDAIGLVRAVLDRGRDGATYHASDAEPLRRRDVVRWVAARLGIEPPRGEELPSGGRAANRRVLSVATREELRYDLRHPSLREGLLPLLASIPITRG
jgi:nucleoside-diphosphate-sugar epimerase